MLKKLLVLVVLIALAIPAAAVFAQDGTLLEVAEKDGRFKTLIAAVDAAGLRDTLNGAGPFTVFAPTDEAFAKLPPAAVAYLLANKDALTRVLTYHVVGSEETAEKVMAAETLKSVEGSDLTVAKIGEGVQVGGANVIAADVKASNGLIHVVDEVILPSFELPEVDPLAVEGNIIAAGSSTVYPLTERMADLFGEAGFEGNGAITVDSVGTGAGFERFCKNAETDIANASRPVKSSEIDDCKAQNRELLEFYVAIDALAVVVSVENTFVDSLTIEQLAKLYSGEFTTWQQVNAEWPAETIKLYSPGTDSGTFDYFVEVVLENDDAKILNAPGLEQSEDDNVLVQGVVGSQYAIGYFGYAYYLPNSDKLRAVNIEGVEPNAATAESGEYPLSRPLFIYTTAQLLKEKPQLAAFVNFYITGAAEQLGVEAGQIGYFPVSKNAENLNRLLWLIATAQ